MPAITIELLFKYSLSISCDKKKRALQDIAFKHQNIPLPTTFSAITPENLNSIELQSDLMKQFLLYKDRIDNYRDTIAENNGKLWPYLALSTQMAIFYAKSQNWPYVLIFEDDAWPNKNIKTELQNYVNELNSLFTAHENIDVVVLGFNKEYNANAPKKKYKFFNFFEDNAAVIGSQSYIVPSSSYDKLLRTHIIPSDYLINTCRTKAIVNSFNSMWFCQFQHDGWRQTKSISAASNYKKCYIYWKKYSETPFEKNMLPFEELEVPESYDEYINKSYTNMNLKEDNLISTPEDLFAHSLRISVDTARRTLQDLVFNIVGLPKTNNINGIQVKDDGHINVDVLCDEQKQFIESDSTDVEILYSEIKKHKSPAHYDRIKMCTLAHKSAVAYAKQHNWPYVLILEDDAWPRKNLAKDLPSLLNDINAIYKDHHDEIDMFLIGAVKPYKWGKMPVGKYANFEYFPSGATFLGTQSYILLAKAYDALLNAKFAHNTESSINNVIHSKAIYKNSPWFIQYTNKLWRLNSTITGQRSKLDGQNIKADDANHSYFYWRVYTNTPPKFAVSFEDLGLPKSYDDYIKSISMHSSINSKLEVGKKLLQLFDKFCIVMTTRPKIKNITLKTLQSIGILTEKNIINGKVHIQYDMPNVARSIVQHAVPKLNVYNKNDTCFAVTLNHYYALAAAYYSGAEHALVFEDDAIILKDYSCMLDYLENIPENWDFVNFGCLPTGGQNGIQNFKDMLSASSSTSHYAMLKNGRNAHAFGISRKLMQKMLAKIEARMLGNEDAELLVNDQWFNSRIFTDCNMWFSRKPLFVQQWDETCKSKHKVYDMYYSLYPDCKKEDYEHQS